MKNLFIIVLGYLLFFSSCDGLSLKQLHHELSKIDSLSVADGNIRNPSIEMSVPLMETMGSFLHIVQKDGDRCLLSNGEVIAGSKIYFTRYDSRLDKHRNNLSINGEISYQAKVGDLIFKLRNHYELVTITAVSQQKIKSIKIHNVAQGNQGNLDNLGINQSFTVGDISGGVLTLVNVVLDSGDCFTAKAIDNPFWLDAKVGMVVLKNQINFGKRFYYELLQDNFY